MISRRRSLLMQAQQGPVDILTFGSPVYGLYAEDDSVSPTNGVRQATWPNFGSSAQDWITRTLDPVWRSTGSPFNGKPYFDLLKSTNQAEAFMIDHTLVDALVQPGTVVAVANWHTSNDCLFDADRTAPTQGWHLKHNAGKWNMQAGGTVAVLGTVTVNVPYLIVAEFNGASSTLRINGVDIGTGLNIGTNACDGFCFGTRQGPDDYWNGFLAYGAVYGSLIRTDPRFDEFEQALADHYGIGLP